MYVYVQLIHFVIQQKLTQHLKQLYYNKDVKKRKKKSGLDIVVERMTPCMKEANSYWHHDVKLDASKPKESSELVS